MSKMTILDIILVIAYVAAMIFFLVIKGVYGPTLTTIMFVIAAILVIFSVLAMVLQSKKKDNAIS